MVIGMIINIALITTIAMVRVIPINTGRTWIEKKAGICLFRIPKKKEWMTSIRNGKNLARLALAILKKVRSKRIPGNIKRLTLVLMQNRRAMEREARIEIIKKPGRGMTMKATISSHTDKTAKSGSKNGSSEYS